MSKIQYPMTTAAIFDDVVYPLHFDNAGKVRQEMEGAVNWFCRWRNEEKAAVKARLLVSCWGQYLSHEQVSGRPHDTHYQNHSRHAYRDIRKPDRSRSAFIVPSQHSKALSVRQRSQTPCSSKRRSNDSSGRERYL